MDPVEQSDFVITRSFDVPRELVWKAWTEPARFVQWWGPKGFRVSSLKLDLREGGLLHYGLQSLHGQELWGKFVYHVVDPPRRLEFVIAFSDAGGATVRHPWNPLWPLEVFDILALDEHVGNTVLSLRGKPIHASEEECRAFVAGREGLRQGMGGTLAQLAAYLATVRQEEALDQPTVG